MKFFKRTDLFIIGVILLISAGIWIIYQFRFGDSPAKAEIYHNSVLVMTVELDTEIDRSFSLSQNEHVVFHLFADGSICFEYSDCPDKVCVKSGRLRTVGQSAACLPNQIIMKIVPKKGYNKNDIDITT